MPRLWHPGDGVLDGKVDVTEGVMFPLCICERWLNIIELGKAMRDSDIVGGTL